MTNFNPCRPSPRPPKSRKGQPAPPQTHTQTSGLAQPLLGALFPGSTRGLAQSKSWKAPGAFRHDVLASAGQGSPPPMQPWSAGAPRTHPGRAASPPGEGRRAGGGREGRWRQFRRQPRAPAAPPPPRRRRAWGAPGKVEAPRGENTHWPTGPSRPRPRGPLRGISPPHLRPLPRASRKPAAAGATQRAPGGNREASGAGIPKQQARPGGGVPIKPTLWRRAAKRLRSAPSLQRPQCRPKYFLVEGTVADHSWGN